VANTDIDAVKKRKNAERNKKVNVYLSSLMMKVPDHVYVLRIGYIF
jgi:hypothetical protein